MSINTNIITSELARCKNVRLNLASLYVDATIVGNITMMTRYATDASLLYYFEQCLTNSIRFERSDTYIQHCISTIREYLRAYGIDSVIDYFISKYSSIVCPTVVGIPGTIVNPLATIVTTVTNNITIVNGAEQEFKSYNLIINSIGQTTINLPFTLGDVDTDILLLEVNGDDPTYGENEDYHIVDDVLYWHNEYRLRPGMSVTIRWKL